jgi:plasmid stabilization system protein ParE
MRLWFHPEAKAEFLESVQYYESQQPGLGRRFLGAVRETLHRIQTHPNMYRVVSGAWRQCRVSRFPFGIIYRVEDRRIEIIAVMHLHRKPGYWDHRSKPGAN